ncbi:MAG: tetratricopeptide repeat protein [Acidobacteriota bacterium]|nr:tetratricopeptide repeat protein [Acidobacteriota bacterium]
MWLPAAFFYLLQAAADPTEEGRKALDANQYDRAVELFQKAVAQDGKDYGAHFHLALAYSLKNDDAHAIPEYEKTLELKPGLYQGELNLGISLLRANRAADSAPHLAAAAIQKPNEIQPQMKLADAYLATQDYAKAEEHYRAALALNKKLAAAELGLGRTAVAQNQLDSGARHFRNAAELDPKYQDALLELAGDYEKAKQPALAIPIYQQFPGNAGAQERLGELLLEGKQFAEAVPRLEQAVAASPTAANRLALATAYRMNKQPQKESEQLAKAVAAAPQDYDLRMVYGRALRDQRLFPAAAQQFYAAAQQRPDSKEAWNEMAAVLIIHEDYAQGLAALDKVKALGQESPGNLFMRAITLDRLKQLKPALESYQQFLATDGGKNADQEFEARQRSRIIRLELSKK